MHAAMCNPTPNCKRQSQPPSSTMSNVSLRSRSLAFPPSNGGQKGNGSEVGICDGHVDGGVDGDVDGGAGDEIPYSTVGVG